MPLTKPFRRTVRPFTDQTYHGPSADWMYMLHPDFAESPRHYVRAFKLILSDFDELLNYVEPCDQNLETVSLKIHELLVRTCIEIEANFTAILRENNYGNGKWNLEKDFSKIELSHKLSEYRVRMPLWKGTSDIRMPFKNWSDRSKKNWHILPWYQANNKSKHYRHEHFDKATFGNLIDALGGLVVLLSAQFREEEYSTGAKALSIGGHYSYGFDPNWQDTIGGYFRVQYPSSWLKDELYDFNWQSLSSNTCPFDTIDFKSLNP